MQVRWDWVVFYTVMIPAEVFGIWGRWWGLIACWMAYGLGRWDADFGKKWRA